MTALSPGHSQVTRAAFAALIYDPARARAYRVRRATGAEAGVSETRLGIRFLGEDG